MKNLTLSILLIGLNMTALSQNSENILTNKNGINILPEKGDISIGIDAVPFLNMLNNKGTSPGFNFINDIPTISLKVFLSDRSAIRLDILANYSNTKDGDENLTNFFQEINESFGLNIGYEWRLGKTRVQGFYGVVGGAAYGREKTSSNNTVYQEMSALSFGLDGFIGAEYFIAPKLSIGGLFSWGPGYIIANDITGNSKTTGLIISANNLEGALILSFAF